MKRRQNSFLAKNESPSHIELRLQRLVFILVLLAVGRPSFARVAITLQTQEGNATPATGAPLTMTLQDALKRARENDSQYRSAAVTELGVAREIACRPAPHCCPT